MFTYSKRSGIFAQTRKGKGEVGTVLFPAFFQSTPQGGSVAPGVSLGGWALLFLPALPPLWLPLLSCLFSDRWDKWVSSLRPQPCSVCPSGASPSCPLSKLSCVDPRVSIPGPVIPGSHRPIPRTGHTHSPPDLTPESSQLHHRAHTTMPQI